MVRRLYIIAMALLLCTAALPMGSARAEDGGPVFSLQTSNSKLAVGSVFKVTVKADRLHDVYGYEFNLYFDPSRLEYVENSAATDLDGYSVPAKVVQQDKTYVRFAHVKTANVPGFSGNAALLSLSFKVKQASSTTLELKDIKLIDSKFVESVLDTSVKANLTPDTSSPGGNGNNGNSSNSGETNTGGNQPDTDKQTLVLTAKELSNPTSGKVRATLPPGASKVQLPGNAYELLGDNDLEILSGKDTFLIPSAVLRQLADEVTPEQARQSTITLTSAPVTGLAEQSALLPDESNTDGFEVRFGSGVYDFQLTLTTADGKSIELKTFKQPVTIRLQANSDINPRLSSIYYIPGTGPLERIESDYNNGEFRAKVNHFSVYAVVEKKKKFKDVPASFWASNVITELASKQIINGTSATAFEPQRSITRAEFTALLVRAIKLSSSAKTAFTDVKPSDWFSGDIAAAIESGIVNGKSVSNFAPYAQITREEMVTMMMRAYKLQKGATTDAAAPSFTDEVNISPWAISHVKEAAALGLIKGRSGNSFAPQGISTRAEAAQVIYNLIENTAAASARP
ncbi:S-layer homology domain-containing protein [Paenibacillus sp. GCM10012307]|uniref:S-layer homology domain-containing protein n=1 Tax=Paenibacillus roseus TaxID=2798579 RepID=A0A934MPM1_9BACL|nr:S-layer homology domain-containing protein [Paenibacillus roseus]MBJ6360549.1 S-layer homology domain-containing protein [Paenibacillus roseus]